MWGCKLMPTLQHLQPIVGTVWVLTFASTGLTSPRLASAEAAPLPAVPWQPGPSRYLVTVPGVEQPTLSLYPPNGVVGVATGDSLRTSLKEPNDGGKNWYFVELYDHMCPHCWYAVPIVTQVAGAFKGNPSWSMASLNCHMRSNAEVCFFLEIISGAMDYPTFLLCPPQGPKQIIAQDTIKHLPERARGLLNHLAGQQKTAFMELLRCTMRYVEQHANPGQEDPFLSAQEVSEWVMKNTGLQVVNLAKLKQGADFTDKVPPDPRAVPGRPGWLRDDKEGAPGVPAWEPGQRWLDALQGFISLLYTGYRDHNHQAAVDSSEFLSRTFPVKGAALAELAHRLKIRGPFAHPKDFRVFLMDWARSEMLLNSMEPELAPIMSSEGKGNNEYLTCVGSTCVMWTLLHVTLTAVAARGLSHRRLHDDESVTYAPGEFASIQDAVTFVRTFVEAFLNCGPCKINFLRDFVNCEYGRCTIKEFRGLPLWLWRMHNAVSLRVATRHEAKVDRRWPMYEDCPTCWKPELVMGGQQQARRLQFWRRQDSLASAPPRQPISQADLDYPFHTNRVFWHMVRTYIGVNRVAFDLADLNREEQEEVQAVLEREQAIAAGKTVPHKPPQIEDTREVPWVWPLRKLLISLAALASGVVGLLCYHQCDLSRVAQMFGTLERTTRAPVIRSPQECAAASAQEDDADLSEDCEHLKADRDEEPAAE